MDFVKQLGARGDGTSAETATSDPYAAPMFRDANCQQLPSPSNADGDLGPPTLNQFRTMLEDVVREAQAWASKSLWEKLAPLGEEDMLASSVEKLVAAVAKLVATKGTISSSSTPISEESQEDSLKPDSQHASLAKGHGSACSPVYPHAPDTMDEALCQRAPDPADQSSTPTEPDAGTLCRDGASALQGLTPPSTNEDHGPPSAEPLTIYERYASLRPFTASCPEETGGTHGQAGDVASLSHEVAPPSSHCEQNNLPAEALNGSTRGIWAALSKDDLSLFEYQRGLRPANNDQYPDSGLLSVDKAEQTTPQAVVAPVTLPQQDHVDTAVTKDHVNRLMQEAVHQVGTLPSHPNSTLGSAFGPGLEQIKERCVAKLGDVAEAVNRLYEDAITLQASNKTLSQKALYLNQSLVPIVTDMWGNGLAQGVTNHVPASSSDGPTLRAALTKNTDRRPRQTRWF